MKYLLLFCLFICINNVLSKVCYWNSGNQYKLFSSKSSYNSIRGDIRDSVVKIKGCEPISIWGLYRHGKRNIGNTFMPSVISAIDKRNAINIYNSSMCAQDVENLLEWKPDKKLYDDVYLTDEGHYDMVGLGRRLKETFPELLENLEEGNYTFRSVFGRYIEDSATGFLEGLNKINLTVEEPFVQGDNMVPYMTCNKYLVEVRRNPDVYMETKKYMNGSEYKDAIKGIQQRTGLNDALTEDNIIGMYDLCRYNWSGIDNKPSPWCSLFTYEDLKIFEYIGDLRHYYRNGYGAPMNEQFGQLPMADLLINFQKAKDGELRKISAYFSHASMLDMIFTALGLFNDEPPISGAFRNPNRSWRSSRSAFSANLVAVLSRCVRDDVIDHKVVFYLNEEPLKDMCDQGVCSWQEFEDKFKPFLNTTIDFC